MLDKEVILQNENLIENQATVLFDYVFLKNILTGILVTGRVLSSLTNLILKFLIDKIDHMYVVFQQKLTNHFVFGHVYKVVVVHLAFGVP